MTKVLTTRVDIEVAKRVEEATKKHKVDKASFLRMLLVKGLEEVECEDALECYKQGEISLGKLSGMLHLNLWDTLNLLQEKKIYFNYGEEDLREDLGNFTFIS